jgi:3-hydroxymyristoyl/3-hydroxydecanoyl-(acyl carrier protein) dehydratase
MINLETTFQFSIPTFSAQADGFELNWSVPANLSYFEGHFPNQPMLPAIAVFDANLFALEKYLGRAIQIKKLVSAKFSAPIAPNTQIKIKVQKISEGSWQFQWLDANQLLLAHMMLVVD